LFCRCLRLHGRGAIPLKLSLGILESFLATTGLDLIKLLP
jgi:hypothetical protein